MRLTWGLVAGDWLLCCDEHLVGRCTKENGFWRADTEGELSWYFVGKYTRLRDAKKALKKLVIEIW